MSISGVAVATSNVIYNQFFIANKKEFLFHKEIYFIVNYKMLIKINFVIGYVIFENLNHRNRINC